MVRHDSTDTGSGPAFFEIELAGPAERGHGLLAGMLLAGESARHVFFASDLGGGRTSLRRQLREVVTGHGAGCRAVVDAGMLELLQRHAARIEAEAGLILRRRAAVRAARFSFRYRAFSRPHGEEIRALLAALPAGVRLDGGPATETLDPAAKGVEAYTPAHEYELAGEGAVSGRVDLVVAAHHLLEPNALIQLEPIELERA